MLVGFDEKTASLWKVYSQVVKPGAVVKFEGNQNDPRELYNFYEAVVNALRPSVKEGVGSIILASPLRTSFSRRFIEHVKRHHAWLTQGINKIVIAEIVGSAKSRSDVAALTKNPLFMKLIGEATLEETENLLEVLENKLGSSNMTDAVLYSLEEIENSIIYACKNKVKPEFLLLTNRYLAESRYRNRANRLMQIAANQKIRTRIVEADSPAGKRLSQLGGIVCLAKNV